MHASLLFWLALALPGYVVVRHIWTDDLKSGLLGTIGLSYLITFGLLSPVSIVCYLLGAPLWVFSATCVIAVVTALIELTRRGWWRDTGKLIAGAFTFELAIIVVDLVMATRVGAVLAGDAVTHMARIRVLLDHGFNNQDPFVAGGYFFPIYHTNLIHALYASCSQLTGIHHAWVWFASLSWGKLLVASGSYYMAWCVFDRRWVGWVAAVFTVGAHGSLNFVVYPNKLAPLWILPLMIGFVVQACQPPCTWKSPLKLAIGSLVVGQVHSLYGAFAGLALGPVLGGFAVVTILRRRPGGWRLGACVVALTAALPFLAVSKVTSNPKPEFSPAAKAEVKQPGASIDSETQWVTMGPRSGWGTVRGWRPLCLAVGIICALVGSRRRHTAILLAAAGIVALIFYVPPLCTAALHIFEKKWILSRMGLILYLGFAGLVPASVAYLVEPKPSQWWLRWILSAAALCFGMAFVTHKEPNTWERYYAKAVAPGPERHKHLGWTRQVVGFCKRNIPRGETVLVEKWSGMVLTMIHDCHIVAPERGSVGVPDLNQRRKDLEIMLAPYTPWETRRALLRQYNIKYFFPASSSTDWTRGHTLPRKAEPGFHLFLLDTD